MNVELLTLVFMVLPADMACMRLLVMCGKVCRAWKAMMLVIQDKTDGMSLTARYCELARYFRRDLRVQMLQRYRTELADARARRLAILEAEEFEEHLDHQIHVQLATAFELAVRYLCDALQEHLLDADTMLLCVRELSRLTNAYDEEIVVPLRLTRWCQWPLLKILQAHPTNSRLGSLVLSVLCQFRSLEINAFSGYESIHREEDRLTARGIVSVFLANFPQPQAVWATLLPAERQQMFVVRKMQDAGNDVLTWIDLGTVIHATDNT